MPQNDPVLPRFAAGLAGALLAIGAMVCAPAGAVDETAGAPGKPPFARVLVLGVSPNPNQRCPFERFLASSMKSEATTAIASCDVMDYKTPITREVIDKAVAEYQLDAVLATSLVGSQLSAGEGGSRDTRGSGEYKAIDSGWAYYGGYYGVYGVPVVYGEFVTTPSIFTMQGEVELVSRLYETQGATLVHEVKTKAKDLESRADALAKVTPPIAKKLRRERLIR
ncbi:MAG: hypothetical protein MUC71_03960 [Steroidobacteraceae bacterium]|jgi:hypothetical protein|nr:hypothetical protein [Steroidobacteraceae bacterium]